jgi:hypothetical protein
MVLSPNLALQNFVFDPPLPAEFGGPQASNERKHRKQTMPPAQTKANCSKTGGDMDTSIL